MLRWLGKTLREPLLLFLLLGGGLFAFYQGLQPAGSGLAPDSETIVVTQARLQILQESFNRVWQRSPSSDELRGLVAAFVREEVYYREAVVMGLDRDDTIVRRRMQQKMEFLTEDLDQPAAPEDAELQAWLGQHPQKFQRDATLSFRQVYLDPGLHGAKLQADAQLLLSELSGLSDPALSAGQGDRLALLQPAYTNVTHHQVARLFGDELAAQLMEMPTGQWQGPYPSGYGLHLLHVERRSVPVMPELSAVRAAVTDDLLASRQREAREKYYQSLLERYQVKIEAQVLTTTTPGLVRLSNAEQGQ